MHDFESAAWTEHRGQWTATIATALGQIAHAFDRLQHQRFDAPWRTPTQNCG